MSGLSIGLSTFNSCNKAGSIPHFTQHLSRYPSDYQALTWRGRAYSIIGKTAEAKADFQKACRVSSGSQNLLAQALIEHIDGNRKQKVAILQNTTRQYPNCSEAWFELGSLIQGFGDEAVDLSLQNLEKANDLAKMNSETKDPWYPWCRQKMGDIHFYEKQQVYEARKHYKAAVKSCNFLTIGHLGLSRCHILNDDLARAKTSFLTAKDLNPVLVQWKTFDDFCRQVQRGYTLASLASEFSKSFSDLLAEPLHIKTEREQQQRQINGQDTSSFSNVSGARSRDTRVQSSSRSVSEAMLPLHDQDQEQFHEYMASSYRHQPARYSDGAKPRSKTHRSVTSVCHGGRSGGSSGNGGSGDGSDDDGNVSFYSDIHHYQDWGQFHELMAQVITNQQSTHSDGAKPRSRDASELLKSFSDLLAEPLHIKTETEKQQRQIKVQDTSSFSNVSGARSRDTRVQSSSRSVSEAMLPLHDQDQEQFHEYMASSYRHQPARYSDGAKPRSKTHRSVTSVCHGGRSGGSSGNGGSGDGSDDDGDDKEPKAERKWKRITKNAPSAKKYRGKTFYQSKDKENWYTKIKASERHGRDKKSYLKIYEDKGRTIKLIGSLDENFEEMSEKHESGKFDVIKKSDMDGIF